MMCSFLPALLRKSIRPICSLLFSSLEIACYPSPRRAVRTAPRGSPVYAKRLPQALANVALRGAQLFAQRLQPAEMPFLVGDHSGERLGGAPFEVAQHLGVENV